MIPVDINLYAVLASAFSNMVLGFLWYSPWFLGKPWLSALGWSPEDLAKAKQKGMGTTYALTTLTAVFLAAVLSALFAALQIEDLEIGLLVSFLVWLGFMIPASAGAVLFEGRRPALFWISSGYYLASLWIMSAILVFWP